MQKYFIDKQIIGILFNIEAEDELNAVYLDHLTSITKLVKDNIKQFLQIKGVKDEDLSVIMKLEELPDEQDLVFSDPKVYELLKDKELEVMIINKIDQYNQIIYKLQLPKLSEEQKQKLNSYLSLVEDDFKSSNLDVLVLLTALRLDLFENVTLDTNSARSPQTPQVNLGGVNTSPQGPITSESNEPQVENPPEKLPGPQNQPSPTQVRESVQPNQPTQ